MLRVENPSGGDIGVLSANTGRHQFWELFTLLRRQQRFSDQMKARAQLGPRTSIAKPFQEASRSCLFSSSSSKSTNALIMLAVFSKFLSKTFHTVEIRSRALDSNERYPRIAALTAGTAVVGFAAKDCKRAIKAECLLINPFRSV